MCTAMTLMSLRQDSFFGRTMDFSYPIEPQLFRMPKDYSWHSAAGPDYFKNRLSFLGLGQTYQHLLAFFDGVNECGFGAAALYFPDYARYELHPQVKNTGPAIAAYDFLHYLLGNCGSVADLKTVAREVRLSPVKDPVTQTVAPLHWIAADKSGACAVIEQTEQGMKIYANPLGVLTNSPDLTWHLTNLRNYMDVSPTQTKEVVWGPVTLHPFGQAGGTVNLPGGFTSPERFVRAAYLKTHIVPPRDEREALSACFHIADAVSIPKGVVETDRGTYDYTKYVAFMDLNACRYYYRMYEDNHILTAGLSERNPPPLK